MNNVINDSERPMRNITWQAQPHSAQCDHQHEVIAHEAGVGQCVECGSLEAA